MKNYRRKTSWLHLFILLVLVGAAVQGLTKELGWTIVASRSTIEAAPGVATGRQDTRAVKGRQEPIEVFEVLGLEEENH